MAKQPLIEKEGIVIKVLPDNKFVVKLDNGAEIMTYGRGLLGRKRVRVAEGNRVKVEISPTDLKHGRIVYRHRKK